MKRLKDLAEIGNSSLNVLLEKGLYSRFPLTSPLTLSVPRLCDSLSTAQLIYREDSFR